MASRSGATRTASSNKPDFEGFNSPLVDERYGQYMHAHRKLADGTLRESDNWQKGISLEDYAKSLKRHEHQLHMIHRGYESLDYDTGKSIDIEDALCAIIFNAKGYLHELRKRSLARSGRAKA